MRNRTDCPECGAETLETSYLVVEVPCGNNSSAILGNNEYSFEYVADALNRPISRYANYVVEQSYDKVTRNVCFRAYFQSIESGKPPCKKCVSTKIARELLQYKNDLFEDALDYGSLPQHAWLWDELWNAQVRFYITNEKPQQGKVDWEEVSTEVVL